MIIRQSGKTREKSLDKIAYFYGRDRDKRHYRIEFVRRITNAADARMIDRKFISDFPRTEIRERKIDPRGADLLPRINKACIKRATNRTLRVNSTEPLMLIYIARLSRPIVRVIDDARETMMVYINIF